MFSPFCKGFTRNITRLSQRGWCSFWCWTFLSHLQKRFNLLGTGHLRPAALGNWWNITATGGREGLCPDLALICKKKGLNTEKEGSGGYLIQLYSWRSRRSYPTETGRVCSSKTENQNISKQSLLPYPTDKSPVITIVDCSWKSHKSRLFMGNSTKGEEKPRGETKTVTRGV